MEIEMEVKEINMSDENFIELVGSFSPDMSDEEVIAMIDEIEAEEAAREELFDHFANGER